MMMKCFLVYILLLLCISCTNKKSSYPCQVIENPSIESYPIVDLVGKELPWQDSTLLDPYRMWIQDSLLIFQDYIGKEKGFVSYYSLNTYKLITTFGVIGRGPHEYLTPRIHWNDEHSFLIIEKLRYSILNHDSLLYASDYSPLRHNVQLGLMAASEVYLLNDSLLFVHSGMTDEQFSIVDICNKEYILKYKNFPRVFSNKRLTDFIANSNVYSAYYLLNPSHDTLAIVYKHYPIIDIVSMSDLYVKRIQFPIGKSVNRITILDKLNAYIEDEVIYYTQYCYSDKYFYLLYNATLGKSIDDLEKVEIHKFDWQGNLVMRYKLNCYIKTFFVDEKTNKIYVASKKEEGMDYSIQVLSFNMNASN